MIADQMTTFFTGCTIELVSPASAEKDDIAQWWRIYGPRHHVGEEAFMERFMGFDRVVFFRDSHTRRIVGGSGFRIMVYRLLTGRIVNAIYIAQSYILPKYRGRKLLSMSYARVVLECKAKNPLRPVWFWMDALSYKPYMILGNHVREHYPSPRWTMPDWVIDLRDRIGHRYYPGLYDAATGVVKKNARRLKATEGEIRDQDLCNEYIRFYVMQNPGHVHGEGLLCVFPGSIKNVLYFIWLVLRQTFGKFHES